MSADPEIPRARVTAERVRFTPVAPLERPGTHVLVATFEPGGILQLEPLTDDPAALARALRSLTTFLVENPSMIDSAAGVPPTAPPPGSENGRHG